MIASIVISILPMPLFYLIYFRHFFTYYRMKGIKPVFIKHVEGLLYGVAVAIILILLSPALDELFKGGSIAVDSFVKAALVEKMGALAAILLLQRYYPRFSLLEGVSSGLIVGAGFSLVENVFYALNYGTPVVLVRALFSVPLHLSTCALTGYFAGAAKLCATAPYRTLHYARAITVPVALHGVFDLFIMQGGGFTYLVGPLAIIITGMLELFIAWAKLVPPVQGLAAENLRFEDWLLKYRQPRFERWILNSMGTPRAVRVPFFRPLMNPALWAASAALVAGGLALLPFRAETVTLLGIALRPAEQILVVTVFPASIGISLAMAGAVNPDFFRLSMVRIPVIFDAVLKSPGGEDSLVSFDITPVNCFLRTFEPLDPAGEAEIVFERKGFHSPAVKARAVWNNHGAHMGDEPTGTIVKFIGPPLSFFRFAMGYYYYRLRKGIIYNLKLPGFEGVRRLFMLPQTVMQSELVLRAGSMVFRQGEDANSFYFIKKGQVNIYKELDSGKRILLESMEAGQIFNEMALLGETRRGVTAECPVNTILARAHADNLEALIKYNPDFAFALVRKLAGRVDRTQESLTQTIEYIQKLADMRSAHSRNAAVLLAWAMGHDPRGSGSLAVDADTPAAALDVTPDELLRYIAGSLFEAPHDHEGLGTPADPRLVASIEKRLSGTGLKLVRK